MPLQYVITCSTSHLESGVLVCDATTLTQAYLLDPSVQPNLDLLLQGGFDPGLAQQGFLGMLALFSLGLGVGIALRLIFRVR